MAKNQSRAPEPKALMEGRESGQVGTGDYEAKAAFPVWAGHRRES